MNIRVPDDDAPDLLSRDMNESVDQDSSSSSRSLDLSSVDSDDATYRDEEVLDSDSEQSPTRDSTDMNIDDISCTQSSDSPVQNGVQYYFDGLWFDKNHEDFDLMTDDDWMDMEDLELCFGGDGDDNKRKPKHKYERIDWESHIQQKQYANTFQETYHMSLGDFNKLVSILEESVRANEKQSRRSTSGNDPITPQIIVGSTIRFLIGDRIMALSDIYGVSPPSLNRVINKCLNAIATTNHALLSIVLPNPKDPLQLHKLAKKWDSLSTAAGVFMGHLGAIDGWLARTEMPVDVVNKLAYYSGHYACYGLNVQCVVGPDLEFMYVCVAGPGKTNDCRAFSRCLGLLDWLETLPANYFISGDNAYIISDKVLIPHDKKELGGSEDRRAYNYYLSQLRIRVEMAFGLLTTKFRLLRYGLRFYNKKNSLMIQVCTRLHNFCIRQKAFQSNVEMLDEETVRNNPGRYGITPMNHNKLSYNMGYLETTNDNEEDLNKEDMIGKNVNLLVNDNSRRESIVAEISGMGLVRPISNIRRNS